MAILYRNLHLKCLLSAYLTWLKENRKLTWNKHQQIMPVLDYISFGISIMLSNEAIWVVVFDGSIANPFDLFD